MIKKVFISFVLAVGLSATFAQTDRSVREHKVVEIVMQLPANSMAHYQKLMSELIQLDNVMFELIYRLADGGGHNDKMRYAIRGLAMYASKEDAKQKSLIAQSMCNAMGRARTDEIRDFVLTQLQYVAGAESVETAAQYLNNARLAYTAIRVLVCIGNDAAGKKLLEMLGKSTGEQQIVLVKALGDMRYQPASDTLNALVTNDNVSLRDAALYSLAQISNPSLEKKIDVKVGSLPIMEKRDTNDFDTRREPYKVSAAEQAEGFVPMFNSIDMTGWTGDQFGYFVRDGALVSKTIGKFNLFSEKEYSDFVMRFDFKLTPGANNGIGVRSTRDDDDRYRIAFEVQVLDDEDPIYNYQDWNPFHGSVYGVVPSKRGSLNIVGEWNSQEIIVESYRVKVTLNGNVILDCDLAEVTQNFTATRGSSLANKSGHIGLLGHDAEVEFRNMRIKDLTSSYK